MTGLDRPLRISAVTVSDMRVEPMGVSNAIKGRLALVDDQAKVYAFAICHKYSERTYRILEALFESMEADVVDILSRPDREDDDLEIAPRGDDDDGVTFG